MDMEIDEDGFRITHVTRPVPQPYFISKKIKAMMIVDLVRAPANHPTDRHVISFRNTFLNKVKVFGVVTTCKLANTKALFTLDDGTGSIACSLNYARQYCTMEQLECIEERIEELEQSPGSSSELRSDCLKGLSVVLSHVKELVPDESDIKAGEYRILCGFVSNYFQDRRINGFEVSPPLTEDQALHETLKMVKRQQKRNARH